METSNVERILNASDYELSDEAVSAVIQAMNESPEVNRHMEQIVAHPDFPERYEEIINAVKLADTLNVHDAVAINTVLQSDVDPILMEDAIFCLSQNVSAETLREVFNSADFYRTEYDYTDKEVIDRIDNIMTCLKFDCPTSDFQAYFFQAYDADQIEAMASISFAVDKLATFKEEELEYVKNKHPHDYLRTRVFEILNKNQCFNSTLLPDQMKGIWKAVKKEVENFPNWNGEIPVQMSDEIKQMADVIKAYNSYERVYDHIVEKGPYSPYIKPWEIWNNAKEMEVAQQILNSYEAVNNYEALPGLKRICDNIGLNDKDTEQVLSLAELHVDQNDFLREHNAENMEIRAIADMLIQGIPCNDVFDYLEVTGSNKDSLKTLYQCYDEGIAKNVTMKCIEEGLDENRKDELFTANFNGCTNDEQLKLCDKDLSPIQACKMRLGFQEAHEIEKGGSVIGAKLNSNSELADKVNEKKEKITANKEKTIGDD